MTALIVTIVIIALIIVCAILSSKSTKEEKRRYEENEMTDEERKEYEKHLAEKEQRRKAITIQKVQIINSNSNSRKKAGSSISRGIVGGALLGPAGMVGGALSGKNKVTNTTTFLIQYVDGHKETKTVKNDSFEFKKLIQYVEM